MALDAVFKKAILNAFTRMGVEAVFTPAADFPIDCVVDLVKGVAIEEGGYDAPAIVRVTTIEYLKDQLGREAAPGEIFTIGGDEWVVESLFEDPDSNNAFCGKCIVRRQT